MFRQRIPFTQIALATVLGVTGGVYIYRPMFESQRNNSVPETLSHLEDFGTSESQGQSGDCNSVPESQGQSEGGNNVPQNPGGQ
ncbi:protein PIGBOS1 [Esox lucius]|uniref:protein PIGBOS1 n=1 Tax=Esox lucius TaxID=8010 RepID=UPI0009734303|nr:protein PIGBOS1 [Esox lucius]